VGLTAWLILGALTDLAVKAGFGNVAIGVMVRRLLGLPRSVFGTAFAHLGLGLTTLGIVGTLCFGTEKILSMHAGETVELSGYTLRFVGLYPAQGPNYSDDRGRFEMIGVSGSPVGEISSAKRFYPVRQMTTTESGIKTLGLSQLYISLGDEGKDGSVVVRLWWKPLVTLIWGGGLMMMAGAAMSLMDRRLRVGAPARRRRQASVVMPAGQP
jgi:cytochrome c-type biogenesis protein CcmF